MTSGRVTLPPGRIGYASGKLPYNAHTAEVICLRSRTRISSEKPLWP